MLKLLASASNVDPSFIDHLLTGDGRGVSPKGDQVTHTKIGIGRTNGQASSEASILRHVASGRRLSSSSSW